MVASVEKKTSTSGAPAPCVPWLHTVAEIATAAPGSAAGAVLTAETTQSGPLPTPTRFPASELLSSNSSGVELNGSATAPIQYPPACGALKVPLTRSHAPGCSHGIGGNRPERKSLLVM